MLDWDPEIDTPATIVVIGGGAAGIEAALYARYLGYSVFVFEQSSVGRSMANWGDRILDEVASAASSPLGRAALHAQGNTDHLDKLASESTITYREYVEKYLIPVAKTDLLYENIQINSSVQGISRMIGQGRDRLSSEQLAESEFRVLIDSAKRGPFALIADIILDCSGLQPRPGLAVGGGLAVGESTQRTERENRELGWYRGKVDLLGKKRDAFAGKKTILWGNSPTACANALDFVSLAGETEGSKLNWLFPKQADGKPAWPIEDANSRQPWTDDDIQRVNAFRENAPAGSTHMDAWGIDAVSRSDNGQWVIKTQTSLEDSMELQCDCFIDCGTEVANWGWLCDLDAERSLPWEKEESIPSPLTAEPHYYVLGQKSSRQGAAMRPSEVHSQIREVFAMIGGRADLDLYKTVQQQAQG